jgi:hypothetical protein
LVEGSASFSCVLPFVVVVKVGLKNDVVSIYLKFIEILFRDMFPHTPNEAIGLPSE